MKIIVEKINNKYVVTAGTIVKVFETMKEMITYIDKLLGEKI